jgi:hypothetical protein
VETGIGNCATVGALDGINRDVGDPVGKSDGSISGFGLGNTEGITEGPKDKGSLSVDGNVVERDGTIYGTALGVAVELVLGVAVGKRLGGNIGVTKGALDEKVVGATVGLVNGIIEAIVGEIDGARLGPWEEAIVG